MVVSWSAGESQVLTLRAPLPQAGRRFVFLGSASGTAPGFSLFGLHVPLNPDSYMRSGLFCAGLSPLQPLTGRLNDDAQASARFELSRRGRAWIGRTFHHAYIVLDRRARPVFVSIAVPVTVGP